MRRISGQAGSSKSSSSQPESGKAPPTDAMSSTAKLILETLDKMSTPLRDVSKMPTVSLADRKRVAEELNNSLGLTSSARKRPRLGSGPVTAGGSPLGGPPFRKLYSPLSANRSRPPTRVNHVLTPKVSLNHAGSNSIDGSRSSTPCSDLGSGGSAPPAPPNLSLSSFSTPVSSGAGGGKLRNKVTARLGGLTSSTSDQLEHEELPPPLPNFLTNNVPQLKVNTPITGFSFGTTSVDKSDDKLNDKSTGKLAEKSESLTSSVTSDKSGCKVSETAGFSFGSSKSDERSGEKFESDFNQKSVTLAATSKDKSGPPTFGLTQPLKTVTDKSSTALKTSSEDNNNNSNSIQESNKMFSFSSPVQTVLHKDTSLLTTATKSESKSTVIPALPTHRPSDSAASNHNGGGEVLVNGVDKNFAFEAPKVVSSSKTDLSEKCSMSFSFSPPEVADTVAKKGK